MEAFDFAVEAFALAGADRAGLAVLEGLGAGAGLDAFVAAGAFGALAVRLLGAFAPAVAADADAFRFGAINSETMRAVNYVVGPTPCVPTKRSARERQKPRERCLLLLCLSGRRSSKPGLD